jgi:hypothetical protein
MQGEKNEIGFKVKVFGAKSLAKFFNFDERAVYKTLGEAYNLRSVFLHGSDVLFEKVNEIFSDLYEYTVKIMQINARTPDVFFKKNKEKLIFEKQQL